MKTINNLSKIKLKKNQQGLTLIEASMVLALSAVVIAGAVMYYNSAAESNKIQRAQGLLGAIQSAVQSISAINPSYAGLTIADITSNASIPRSFVIGTGKSATVVNPWGGEVLLTTVAASYSVTYKSVSPAACVSLASVDLGNSMIGLTVGTTTLTPENFTSTKISEACMDANKNRSIDILWKFK